jgi:hypothetical protein
VTPYSFNGLDGASPTDASLLDPSATSDILVFGDFSQEAGDWAYVVNSWTVTANV